MIFCLKDFHEQLLQESNNVLILTLLFEFLFIFLMIIFVCFIFNGPNKKVEMKKINE